MSNVTPTTAAPRKKVSLKTLHQMKAQKTSAAAVTAYDYPSAVFADRAGIDWILVGDSGGMTTLGYKNTMPVTMDEMIHFAKAVCRGNQTSFVVGDMPFMSYQISNRAAVKNAGRFMAEASCDAIKLEGGAPLAPRIKAIVQAGIPVMAHLGLTPQSVSMQGGYKVHGKTVAEFQSLCDDAKAVEDAGASFILLEAIPEVVAGLVRDVVSIPVYGIGAGKNLDGQLLILHDMLGTFVGDIKPKFAKMYANLGEMTMAALKSYCFEVKTKAFPAEEHLYPIAPEVLTEIQKEATKSELSGTVVSRSPSMAV